MRVLRQEVESEREKHLRDIFVRAVRRNFLETFEQQEESKAA